MKRFVNTAVCVIFAVFLLGFAAAFWILPDKTFSEDENRTLQTLPAFSLSDWLDGSFSSAINTYYSDQFPLRTKLVSLRALTDLSLGRGESGGVLIGKKGQLAVRLFDAWISRTERAEDTDVWSPSHVDAGLDALVSLKDTLAADGIPLVVLLAPRTVDVTAPSMGYPTELSDRLHEQISSKLSAGDVTSVDLLDGFRKDCADGEYVYYRTDHHWTTAGAYKAYAALLAAFSAELPQLGTAVPLSSFSLRRVPDFYGTTWSRAGAYFVAPDVLEIPETPDDSSYTVSDASHGGEGEILLHGFVDESFLDGKDKYSAFLSGTHALLTVSQTGPDALSVTPDGKGDRPRLLVARDSFASCLIPFLARHADLVVVNLASGRQGRTDLSALARDYGCDGVLILCNWENLITADGIRSVS